jgi:hypothetical protein
MVSSRGLSICVPEACTMNSNNSKDGVRAGFVLLIMGLCLAGGIGAGAWIHSARIRADLKQIWTETRLLRQELQARDTTISALTNDLRKLEFAGGRSHSAFGTSMPNTAHEQHLLEIWRAHSNTVALLDHLTKRIDIISHATSAWDPQRRQSGILKLEQSAAEQEDKINAAMQKLQHLASSLNVPAELDRMPAEAGLLRIELASYWPFFEAKREIEMLRRVCDAMRLRIAQETLEASLQ